jgi:hypothetical protein
MPSFTCPNDGTQMESDGPVTARERKARGNRPATHTCTSCGYTEQR